MLRWVLIFLAIALISAVFGLTILQSLKHKVTHHLEEEEHRFFQMAGKIFTAQQKQALAEQYNKEIAS